MAEIFLYIGTILIAFEIVREVTSLPPLLRSLELKGQQFFQCESQAC